MTAYFLSAPARIFRFDALGAVVSAVSTGLVQPRFYHLLGIPPSVLGALAGLAVACLIYDLICLAGNPTAATRPKLLLLLCANAAYCLVAPLLVWRHRETVTPLGWAVTAAEVLVVLVVVGYEFYLYRCLKSPTG